MKHEELARRIIEVLCDSLGAKWDSERLVPMVLAATKTESSNLRHRMICAIKEIIVREEE